MTLALFSGRLQEENRVDDFFVAFSGTRLLQSVHFSPDLQYRCPCFWNTREYPRRVPEHIAPDIPSTIFSPLFTGGYGYD